ncbi:MAG: dihydroorotate dehydrogenase electron transfer subunit [Muribaculaceae bacterium]|nr:dihydroorotate dehydrogenase electron transfer subunit [Muribaculaceae bacterium]
MKYDLEFKVIDNHQPSNGFALLRLQRADGNALPDILPGQFVEVDVPDSKDTFLRRPISVNFVESDGRTLWLLIREAGEGTRHLARLTAGRIVRLMLPLGNGFTLKTSGRILLVGGGVGTAPLLYLAKKMAESGNRPDVLLGARSSDLILQRNEFDKYANVLTATDDGSEGHHGVVTTHPAMTENNYDLICCCGPAPMMKAVAAVARRRNIDCEVSLENMMACGLGACLCCVENTVNGHVCVCTEGPVFNIKKLNWQ